MTKPHRNNSPSYEDWLVVCMKRAVLSGGEVNEHESLLGDLQRKEREYPFLQVLKMIQRRSLNKGVSSTANRAFLFLASERKGNLGRDNLPRPISSPLCDCNTRRCRGSLHVHSAHTSELKLFQALTRNIEVEILEFGNRVFFIVKKF